MSRKLWKNDLPKTITLRELEGYIKHQNLFTPPKRPTLLALIDEGRLEIVGERREGRAVRVTSCSALAWIASVTAQPSPAQ
jgi:hypothetical protein